MVGLTVKPLGHFYDIGNFCKDLISYSENAQESNVLAFAFILYRDEDYHIVSILHDKARWNALDSVSGDRLCVYSLCESAQFTTQPSKINMMISGTFTRNDIREAPKKITDEIFDRLLNKELKYPSILFFQVTNGAISDSVLFLLSKGENEVLGEMIDCFKEVDAYLRNIVVGKKTERVFCDIFDNTKDVVNDVSNTKAIQRKSCVVKDVIGKVSISFIVGYVKDLIM